MAARLSAIPRYPSLQVFTTHPHHHRPMKKLLAALAATVFSISVAFAQTLPSPTIAAKSWLLLDMNSNQIIASQEPDLRIEPASLTKIMTAYLTFAAITTKKLAL